MRHAVVGYIGFRNIIIRMTFRKPGFMNSETCRNSSLVIVNTLNGYVACAGIMVVGITQAVISFIPTIHMRKGGHLTFKSVFGRNVISTKIIISSGNHDRTLYLFRNDSEAAVLAPDSVGIHSVDCETDFTGIGGIFGIVAHIKPVAAYFGRMNVENLRLAIINPVFNSGKLHIGDVKIFNWLKHGNISNIVDYPEIDCMDLVARIEISRQF